MDAELGGDSESDRMNGGGANAALTGTGEAMGIILGVSSTTANAVGAGKDIDSAGGGLL